MKSLIVLGTVTAALAFPLLVSQPTTAHASQYSAARANSVRLVWRRSMKAHQFHTMRGARYSKHLGTRYAYNRDNITWVTDAHEKLYNKRKHTSAIYYHVHTLYSPHGGWIWRGYLTPGGVEPKVSPAEAAQEKQEQVLVNDLHSLFPGTTMDQQLTNDADQITYPTDGVDAQYVTAGPGQKLIKFSCPGTPSNYLKTYNKLLKKQGYPAATRAQFKGWHIGISVQTDPDYYEGGSSLGDVAIFLEPAK
ncbi:hypothetical protein [Levilactobacillus yonginensis]|uniref:hypothetical protein n=1 Tax=Levilactobacillus yonginensis TaxID=1054041 RepID=UPI00345C9838